MTGTLGPERADLLAASQMALLANINRDPKRQSRPYRVEEFVPHWGGPAPAQDGRDMEAVARAITAAHNRASTVRGGARGDAG